MAQPKYVLHPVVEELMRWAHEHGLHETSWQTVLAELPDKHREIKMLYYEKQRKETLLGGDVQMLAGAMLEKEERGQLSPFTLSVLKRMTEERT